MPLTVTGISHRTAPLDVRERVAFTQAQFGEKLEALCGLEGVREAILVSTCNRTEIYASTDNRAITHIRDWLADQGGLDAGQRQRHFYQHRDRTAVEHLFGVACGLDSVVLGEPQIIGQLKKAWEAARNGGAAGMVTDRLFQCAFAASKQVRHTTGINDHPVSVAYITAILAQQLFGNLARQTVLMIGAGEMIDLCGRYFRQQGIHRLLIANRSPDRAAALAEIHHAEPLRLDEVDARLAEADIVISSTASPLPIIGLESARKAIDVRRHRPTFMVDLGVPRDIDPAIGALRDIYLYTIDDLQQVADENLAERHRAAREARQSIEEAVESFLRWLHGMRAARSLERLRGAAELTADDLARRALNRIEGGVHTGEAVQQMANTLVHRILHGPSVRLRQAAENEQYDMLKAADWLFDPVDDPPEDDS